MTQDPRLYLLLEKVTVLQNFVDGELPRWRLTNPQDQFGIGVHTWRSLNGPWIEAFWRRREDASFSAYRVRLVDKDNLWRGFPVIVELYDIIGEDMSGEIPEFDVEQISTILMNAMKRVSLP